MVSGSFVCIILYWMKYVVILSEDIPWNWNSPPKNDDSHFERQFLRLMGTFRGAQQHLFLFLNIVSFLLKWRKVLGGLDFKPILTLGRKNCHKKDCKMEKIHLEQKMPPSSMFYFPSLIVLLLEGIQFPHKNFFWSHCQWGYEKKMALENLVSCL